MPNQVAELEATVAQMSATVDGLREELVDANERIRALEREFHEAESVEETEDEGDGDFLLPPPGSNGHDDADDEPEPESESAEESADDIIVA